MKASGSIADITREPLPTAPVPHAAITPIAEDLPPLPSGEAADQVIRKQLRPDFVEVAPNLIGHPRADRERRTGSIQQPLPRRLVGQGSGKEFLEVEDFGAAFAEQIGEGVVLMASAADPEDVVEQQFVVIPRCQALQLEIGPVDHDPSELADLGISAEPLR